MSLAEVFVPQLGRALRNVLVWLDKIEAFAEQKSIEASVLLGSRLAPDQADFLGQVQGACDQAKFAAARLAGKEPPYHADNERTVAELRARIQTAIAYLDGFSTEDFLAADRRVVQPKILQGQAMSGADYLVELQLPNFYFHLVTAYAILRHNGVPVGKKDFLGRLTPLKE